MRIANSRRPVAPSSSWRPHRLRHDRTLFALVILNALLLMTTSALADGNVPDDLLRSVAADFGGDNVDDDRPRTTAHNECGGRCSCLGEYMDCANVELRRFEERLPDWITIL